MQDVTVGIDIGTTSIKALAVDADGMVIARARVPHVVSSPAPDLLEHDADQAWRFGPQQALDAVATAGRVRGITIAAMIPSLTAVDERGRPVSPGLLYGDGRGRSNAGGGDPLQSRELYTMLKWSAEHSPGAHGYWPAPAVAAVALGGQPVVDLSTGFSFAPLWDGDWKADELAALGLNPGQMPVVHVDATEPVARIGEAVQTPGIVDAWGESLVAGADGPNDAVVVCGTTLVCWANIPEYCEVPGLWTIPHGRLGLDQFTIGGASNAGGLFLNFVRRLVPEVTGPVEPGNVPVWLPYVRGERTPLHDPDRRGSLHDVNLTHTGAAVMRAGYEASAFSIRRILEMGARHVNRLVATGGGVQDPEWMQALADCTGLPVDTVAVPEGAARGAAWVARVAAGLEESLEAASRWVRYGIRYEPSPAWVPSCSARYEQFCALG